MRSVVTLVLVFVLLVVVLLDGAAMFAAYQSSREMAQAAAEQAAIRFVQSGGNEALARAQAADYVGDQGGELLAVSFHKADARWVETAVRAKADTHVFRYVPGLNRFTDQDSVAIVQF